MTERDALTPEWPYLLYVLLAAGAGGLALCMPAAAVPQQRLRLAGAIVGVAALAGLAVYWGQWIGDVPGRAFFVIFGFIAVISAVCVVVQTNPVYSALFLVLVVLAVTGLCVLAAAEFLAAALVIVYGGAILVKYDFVIMLAQQSGAAAYDARARGPLAAVVVGFALTAGATQAMVSLDPIALHAGRPSPAYRYASSRASEALVRQVALVEEPGAGPALPPGWESNVRAIGMTLMEKYVVAVEVAGLLLLIAMVGALAMARKRIEPEAMTPEEIKLARQDEDLHRRGREAAPF
jgi:NADH-quinone oxidoreductase subunit J